MTVPNIGGDEYWKVVTVVTFGDRSDTGTANNSPISASLPVYK